MSALLLPTSADEQLLGCCDLCAMPLDQSTAPTTQSGSWESAWVELDDLLGPDISPEGSTAASLGFSEIASRCVHGSCMLHYRSAACSSIAVLDLGEPRLKIGYGIV
jgi:hypothetical protein